MIDSLNCCAGACAAFVYRRPRQLVHPPLKLARGENAIEVMTGAMLPLAADCVIPVEQYDVVDGFVSLKSAVASTPVSQCASPRQR